MILTKLTGRPPERPPEHEEDEEDGGYPKLYITVSLTYDAYDCPDSDELCEGWWAEVVGKFDPEDELCVVSWSRYMGPDIDDVDTEIMRRVANKALRHVYNAP